MRQRIEELESEIQSLQDDLILSHRAYEQCKRQLEEKESDSAEQTETSTLHFDVEEVPQQTTTLDIDVKPQATTLDIGLSPQESFEYSLTPQTTTTELELQPPKRQWHTYRNRPQQQPLH